MKFCHREKKEKKKRNQIKFIKYTHRPHALYGIIANKNFKFQNALGQFCFALPFRPCNLALRRADLFVPDARMEERTFALGKNLFI